MPFFLFHRYDHPYTTITTIGAPYTPREQTGQSPGLFPWSFVLAHKPACPFLPPSLHHSKQPSKTITTMLGAQLRTEISKAHIDTSKVKALCRKHPVGIVVDNKIRSRVWLTLLLDGEAPPSLPSISPTARLQGEDARVVDADVKRTRGYLPIFQEPATQETVRMLLTTFCLANDVRYKQGMHELLAPFVALSPDPPLPPLPAEAIYAMFSRFVSRYLGPFFRVSRDACSDNRSSGWEGGREGGREGGVRGLQRWR